MKSNSRIFGVQGSASLVFRTESSTVPNRIGRGYSLNRTHEETWWMTSSGKKVNCQG